MPLNGVRYDQLEQDRKIIRIAMTKAAEVFQITLPDGLEPDVLYHGGFEFPSRYGLLSLHAGERGRELIVVLRLHGIGNRRRLPKAMLFARQTFTTAAKIDGADPRRAAIIVTEEQSETSDPRFQPRFRIDHGGEFFFDARGGRHTAEKRDLSTVAA